MRFISVLYILEKVEKMSNRSHIERGTRYFNPLVNGTGTASLVVGFQTWDISLGFPCPSFSRVTYCLISFELKLATNVGCPFIFPICDTWIRLILQSKTNKGSVVWDIFFKNINLYYVNIEKDSNFVYSVYFICY